LMIEKVRSRAMLFFPSFLQVKDFARFIAGLGDAGNCEC